MATSPPAQTSPKDMRTWIADLDAAGELIRIDKPVDPLTQMGSLLYQSREKALLVREPAARLALPWARRRRTCAMPRIAFGAREDTVVPLVAERMGQLIPPEMVQRRPGQGGHAQERRVRPHRAAGPRRRPARWRARLSAPVSW